MPCQSPLSWPASYLAYRQHSYMTQDTTGIGWKTFRHSFRSWLDQTEAPIGVQRELMRRAGIQTTMNVYGRAMTDGKRQARGNVVEMILKPANNPTTEVAEAAAMAIVV
jgi:integrase